MTLDLAAIRAANAQRQARQAAATPGPWATDGPHVQEFYSEYYDVYQQAPNDWKEHIAAIFIGDDYQDQAQAQNIAQLLVAARTDDAAAVIDALCAEVERLRAGLHTLTTLHAPFCSGDPCRCDLGYVRELAAAPLDPPEG